MAFEIKIRLQHQCPFLDLTTQFQGISYGYCIRTYDVLSLPGVLDSSQIEIARQAFPNFDDWKISSIQDKITYIQMSCLCETFYRTSVTGLIQHHGGLIRYPISYEKGYENYTIMAFNEGVAANILAALDEITDETISIEIISNQNVGISGLFRSQMISGPELFEEITPRQLDILIKAIEMGYYEIPRNIRTADIANQEGVQRYSIDKLLRAAENKILKNLTPFLYFKQYLESKQD